MSYSSGKKTLKGQCRHRGSLSNTYVRRIYSLLYIPSVVDIYTLSSLTSVILPVRNLSCQLGLDDCFFQTNKIMSINSQSPVPLHRQPELDSYFPYGLGPFRGLLWMTFLCLISRVKDYSRTNTVR